MARAIPGASRSITSLVAWKEEKDKTHTQVLMGVSKGMKISPFRDTFAGFSCTFLNSELSCFLYSFHNVRRFQIDVLSLPKACTMALINFQAFFSQLQNGLRFCHRQFSGIHVGLFFLTIM